MKKDKVLFVCANNRIRSQIAAAFLKRLAGERFEAYRACLDPGPPNPLAIEAMLELGIDLPVSQPDDLSILLNGEELFSYLITVCDTGSLKRCPVFPGNVRRQHWSFPDPDIEGTWEDKLEATREVRDGIRAAVVEFIGENM